MFEATADFMPIGGSVGVHAGAVTRKSKAVGGDEAVFKGRKDGGKPEEHLESVFIIEGKVFMCQGISGKDIGDTGMFIREFFAFARLLGRFFVLIGREEILPASFLGSF